MHRFFCSETDIDATCLTFGIFDGVHIGHRAVIEKVISRKYGLRTAAVVFENNPPSCDGELYTIEEKILLFKKLGFDIVEVVPLTNEIRNLSPEDFIQQVIVNGFRPKIIVAGENCRFGNRKKGNIDTIKNLSGKFEYVVESCNTIGVSTKEIKEALKKADTKKATKLLGDTFSITGEVVHGKALGRTVGMPTANIRVDKKKFIPAQGVYATLTSISGINYGGITNIGVRPSVDEEKEITIENHIFDFNENIYGQVITIELYDYIRGVRKFNGINEVKNQVTKDIQVVREKLSY